MTTPPDLARVATREFRIPSDTDGLRLYLRNKRRDDIVSFDGTKTLLFVSGSTYPASASFDLRLDGYSWMDQLADAGYDAWLVDVRGYGQSDKPQEMAAPASDHPPIVRTPVAVRDVATAAAFVRAQADAQKIVLIGWSWGTSLMANYTADHDDAVHKLVLVAPQWIRDTPSLADTGGPLGAYRVVERAAAKARWLGGVPPEAQDRLLPPGWFDAWADANFGTDPAAVLQAPNGTVQDSREFWASGKALYEPERLRVPVLIVHADWDRDCPQEMSRVVFGKLTAAPYRRWVEIGGGTHSVFMEGNRWQVFSAVQAFLDETAGG